MWFDFTVSSRILKCTSLMAAKWLPVALHLFPFCYKLFCKMTVFFTPALWDSCCLELFSHVPTSELISGNVLYWLLCRSHVPILHADRLTDRSCGLGRCRHIFQSKKYGCRLYILKGSQNRFLTQPSRLWTGEESYYFSFRKDSSTLQE